MIIYFKNSFIWASFILCKLLDIFIYLSLLDTFARYLCGKVKAFIYGLLRCVYRRFLAIGILVFLSSFDFGKLVLLVFITDHRTSAFEEFCLHTDFISAIHLDAVYMGFHGYLTFHCIWNKIFSL